MTEDALEVRNRRIDEDYVEVLRQNDGSIMMAFLQSEPMETSPAGRALLDVHWPNGLRIDGRQRGDIEMVELAEDMCASVPVGGAFARLDIVAAIVAAMPGVDHEPEAILERLSCALWGEEKP